MRLYLCQAPPLLEQIVWSKPSPHCCPALQHKSIFPKTSTILYTLFLSTTRKQFFDDKGKKRNKHGPTQFGCHNWHASQGNVRRHDTPSFHPFSRVFHSSHHRRTSPSIPDIVTIFAYDIHRRRWWQNRLIFRRRALWTSSFSPATSCESRPSHHH